MKPRKKKSKIVAKPDAGLSKKKAEILCAEIEKVRAKRKLTPKNLLDHARDEKNPIHGMFEWDDSLAAEKHRIEQARKLIASVEIQVIEIDRPVRAYHSVTVSTVRGGSRHEYVTRDVAVADSHHMTNISADRYAAILGVVKYVEDIDLPKIDHAWATICRTVRQNVPKAVK